MAQKLYDDAALKKKKVARADRQIAQAMKRRSNMHSGKKVDLSHSTRLYEDWKVKMQKRKELQQVKAQEMIQVSMILLDTPNKKSNPRRAQKLYEDAGLKRQRLARLQMAHRLQKTRLTGQAPLSRVNQQAEHRATKLEINPPNRSELERKEKAQILKSKQERENTRWLENKRMRMKERKVRLQREAQVEADKKGQKRVAAEITRQEKRRKATLAAQVAAEKKRKNEKIIAMKNEIKALSSEPIATSLPIPNQTPTEKQAILSEMMEKYGGNSDTAAVASSAAAVIDGSDGDSGYSSNYDDDDEDDYNDEDYDDEETRHIIAGNRPGTLPQKGNQNWNFDFSDHEEDGSSSSSSSLHSHSSSSGSWSPDIEKG